MEESVTEIVEQPAPVPNDRPCIQDMVIADIERRKKIGMERYGTLLQPHNGRDALLDAYEEELDKIQYMKQWIVERTDHRAEGAAAEREKIVGFLRHHADTLEANRDEMFEFALDMARAIETGAHHDTLPAPPPDIDDDAEELIGRLVTTGTIDDAPTHDGSE